MPPFVHQLRVRYSECDPQGVVFNANYVTYFDIAITELWRDAFGDYASLTDAGLDIVVAEITARYRAPARFDDLIDLEVAVSHLGTTSLVTSMRVGKDGQTLVEGDVRHVFVNHGTHAKTAIPDDVRATLERYRPPPAAEAAA